MAHVRVGVERHQMIGGVPLDGPPRWVEIDGIRLPDSACVTRIEHKADCQDMGEVKITLICGGYETVDADFPSES